MACWRWVAWRCSTAAGDRHAQFIIMNVWTGIRLAAAVVIGRLAVAAAVAGAPGAGAAAAAVPLPPPLRAVKASGIVVDGRLDEAVWRQADWLGLDGSYPRIPHDPQTAAILLREFGFNLAQGKQQVKGALAWDEHGLYAAMMVEDVDVQANKTRHNDWIWLEDVGELFLAPGFPARSRQAGAHLELQVNPNGTTRERLYANAMTNAACPFDYRVAVRVDGTLNDSATPDQGYAVEWFIPWRSLRKLGLVQPSFQAVPGAQPVAVRWVTWDLSLFSNIRITRFSLPGSGDVHETTSYRPLVLK